MGRDGRFCTNYGIFFVWGFVNYASVVKSMKLPFESDLSKEYFMFYHGNDQDKLGLISINQLIIGTYAVKKSLVVWINAKNGF